MEISNFAREGATPDELAEKIRAELAAANRQYEAASAKLAQYVADRNSRENLEKTQNMIKKALGVDAAKIIDAPEVKEKLKMAVQENVFLIKSIPDEHFAKVSRAIFQNYRGDKFEEGGLAARLRKIGTITDKRAKFIARDQTAKMIGNLNQIRQESVGIDGYIWRNAQDERVVGRPGGKYPHGNRGHMNHWDREGKFFRWDKPPADGHPGAAYQCRCHSEPYFNVEKVKENAVNI